MSTPAVVTPKKYVRARPILSPLAATPQRKNFSSQEASDTADGLQLQRLVILYCTLIDACLVPSSALELHLLIRLLTVADANVTIDATPLPALASVLQSADHCVAFAAASLRKMSDLLCGLGPVLFPDLVRCPPFCKHVPDLAEKFALLLNTYSTASQIASISVDHTALLTLPFKEDRDSRHNYRTREESMAYKNREESRDAFLYQLRAFLHVKGTMVDAAQANRAIQKIRQSSRVVVDGLIDSNLSWFAEFFCDMLQQIGHVPIQETDADLLRIIDKEKLQKLHRRFSSKATNADRSMKTLAQDPKREAASPLVAAQQHFPGHQEFFFLFIVSADSYKFAMRLRALLIAKLRDLAASNKSPMSEKVIMDSRVFARFLGVLAFSPNWQSSRDSVKTLLASESLDGLLQLSASGLSVATYVDDAIRNKRRVLTVAWVLELLKMARWDVTIVHSRQYRDLLASLRLIQVGCIGCMDVMDPLQNDEFVRQCLEFFFSESVGMTQTMKVQVAATVLLPVANQSAAESSLSESIVMTISSGALLSSNPHIEELASLISDLAQKDPFLLRSPGATRKLRPSIVIPPIRTLHSPISLSPSLAHDEAALSGPTSLPSLIATEGEVSDAFQLKLRDSFFHQQGPLKILFEFVVGQALKNIEAQMAQKCVHTLIPQHVTSDEQFLVIEGRAAEACKSFLNARLDEQIRGVSAILAPPESDPAILRMAVTLAVAHGREAGESVVASVVVGEMKHLKSSVSRNDRKRLFAKDESETRCNHLNAFVTERRDNPVVVTTLISKLVQDIDALPARNETFLISLISLNAELNEWLQHDNTTFPLESTLRLFFESILLLDDRASAIAKWALFESSVSQNARLDTIVELFKLSLRLLSFSRYGLRSLNDCLADDDFLCSLIQLGTQPKDFVAISSLLVLLMETKTVQSSRIKTAVINSGVDVKVLSSTLRATMLR